MKKQQQQQQQQSIDKQTMVYEKHTCTRAQTNALKLDRYLTRRPSVMLAVEHRSIEEERARMVLQPHSHRAVAVVVSSLKGNLPAADARRRQVVRAEGLPDRSLVLRTHQHDSSHTDRSH